MKESVCPSIIRLLLLEESKGIVLSPGDSSTLIISIWAIWSGVFYALYTTTGGAKLFLSVTLKSDATNSLTVGGAFSIFLSNISAFLLSSLIWEFRWPSGDLYSVTSFSLTWIWVDGCHFYPGCRQNYLIVELSILLKIWKIIFRIMMLLVSNVIVRHLTWLFQLWLFMWLIFRDHILIDLNAVDSNTFDECFSHIYLHWSIAMKWRPHCRFNDISKMDVHMSVTG